jgi:hypothetical protein
MEQKTLGKLQIVIGIVAVAFWVLNFVATGMLLGTWRISTDTSAELLIGALALLTGYFNLKAR